MRDPARDDPVLDIHWGQMKLGQMKFVPIYLPNPVLTYETPDLDGPADGAAAASKSQLSELWAQFCSVGLS